MLVVGEQSLGRGRLEKVSLGGCGLCQVFINIIIFLGGGWGQVPTGICRNVLSLHCGIGG